MGVDGHVTSRTRERFALSIWNVLLGLRVAVLLRHTKVNDMNHVRRLRAWSANEEVVWLDVTVDEVLLVDGLYSRKLAAVSITLMQYG